MPRCPGSERSDFFSSDRESKALSLKEIAVLSVPAAKPRNVVGLAASAGGLAALTHVLAALPPDFAAPVLIVQHLDPRHRSWLAEILGKRAALSVCQAQGGELPEAGTVYVAPPDRAADAETHARVLRGILQEGGAELE